MCHGDRRESVVAFIRPPDKRQPVPQAFWLSKGGEFLMPTHQGQECASDQTSVPIRPVTTRSWKPLIVRFLQASLSSELP